MYIYPKDSGEKLEFVQILEWISGNARLKSAKERAMHLRPYTHFQEAKSALLETGEMLYSREKGLHFPDISCPEIQKELHVLRLEGSVLDEKQCLALLHVIQAANGYIHFMSDKKEVYPYLSKLCAELEIEKISTEKIQQVIDEHGLVRSSASSQLASIRRELHQKRRENEKLFQSLMQKWRKAGVLADSGESFMNGRRVLTIVSESKREVRGIIHGSSQTGKATFIEPGETIEINNQILSLESDERQEIRRILRELTKDLRARHRQIEQFFALLVHVDFTRAKMLLASELGAQVPFFREKPIISVSNAKHPILVKKNQANGKQVVPLQLELDKEKSILIISGPNAGGKSIALKTIGLSQLMIQSGIPVCCDPVSEFGFFEHILTDIGDSQSIEYELSTYSSRLLKMKKFIERAGKNTLFLIDEFGTGTDPELGGAMAEVILEELAKSKSFGIITTHYGNIKIAGEELSNVQNACMLFDDRTLEPLYKLETGRPGSSYTFVIAEKSGIPRALIQRAKEKVDTHKVKLDHILKVLQEKKSELNHKLREAEKKQEKLNERIDEAKEKQENYHKKIQDLKEKRESDTKYIILGKKLNELSEKWEKTGNKKEIIADFVKVMGKEKARLTEEKKRWARENTKEKLMEKKRAIIVPGAEVRMAGSKQKGMVIDVQGDKARVEFGSMKSVISIEYLELA